MDDEQVVLCKSDVRWLHGEDLKRDGKWAVVVLTTVDLLGFGPTLRKAYNFPESESLLFFGLFLVRNLLVVLALEQYSVTTWLFPLAVAAACGLLMALIVIRRRVLAGSREPFRTQ